jgi:alkanesulfonate monooxygenase SsuD/methylene tetrahydromethanopterin reductase-like flavin-dependent oxidoreductase (luciferase family)
VADTDAEAEAIGVPAFLSMREHLNSSRHRLNTASEQAPMAATARAARDTVAQGLLYGSPATVCEKLAPLQKIGVGGVILHFRLGPMAWEAAEHSLRLFAEQVAPEFQERHILSASQVV